MKIKNDYIEKFGLIDTIRFEGWVNRAGGQRHPAETIPVDTTLNHASLIWQSTTDGSINKFNNNTQYTNQLYEITVYYTL
jgi:hypothetical protein